MTKPILTPPSGTRDFLPEESSFRSRVFSTVKTVFSLHGFDPFETPAFERLETLSGKYGEEGEKLIYKILKRGEKAVSGEADLALRYDLTVPTMRLYSRNRNKLPSIVKRYQIGPVWRADRPGRGRFREFYQCDVDVIGARAPLADIEVLLALSGALKELGLAEFNIRLNSRSALRALMAAYGVSTGDQAIVLTVLDKLDKIGVTGVVDELSRLAIDDEVIGELVADLQAAAPEEVACARIQALEDGRAALTEVTLISDYVRPFLGTNASITVDPFLARGLDYYTGPIFEFVAKDSRGSIAGGGRYDNLSRLFMKDSVPVCGGSLGIERIILLLLAKQESNMKIRSGCYVTVWDDKSVASALGLCNELRSNGVVADMDVEGGKLGRQLKIADERGFRVVLVQGPDETAAGEIMVKDMASGEQRRVPHNGVVDVLRRILNEPSVS